MPIYEFQCRQCQGVFEELVRMGSNGDELQCPSCGGEQVQKLMSTFYGAQWQQSPLSGLAGHS